MSLTAPPPLTVRQPGEGREGGLVPGLGVVWKLDTAHTNGMVAVVEHPFPVGVLVPPHLHHREDEYSIVTEGRSDSAPATAKSRSAPGGYITKPRKEVHAMWNAGARPGPHDRDHQSRRDSRGSSGSSPSSSRPDHHQPRQGWRSQSATASSSRSRPGCPRSSRGTT